MGGAVSQYVGHQRFLKMTGTGHVSFGVVEGVVRRVLICARFLHMFVHVQSLEMVTRNSAASWIINKLLVRPVGDEPYKL